MLPKVTLVGIELARYVIATMGTNHYTTTAGSTEVKIKMNLTITCRLWRAKHIFIVIFRFIAFHFLPACS